MRLLQEPVYYNVRLDHVVPTSVAEEARWRDTLLID